MKLALRWAAALIALSVIAYIWFARDTSTNSSAAAPDEVARAVEKSNTDELAPIAGIEDASDSSAERVETSISESNVTASTDELAIVHVRVISEDTGAPLARYHVLPQPNPPPESGWSASEASSTIAQPGEFIATNDDGRAALAVVPHRELLVSVHGPGEFANSREVVVPALEPGATIDLELQFPTETDLTFCGLVIDADTRTPIVGAVVHFANDSWTGDADTHARSDADGVFELAARSWLDSQVRIDAEGYGPAIVALTAGHATRADAFEIGLSRVGTLEVLVLDSGVPFANAQVSVRAESYHFWTSSYVQPFTDDRSEPSWSARSGADGIARFLQLPARVPFELDARTTERSRANVRYIQLEPGETQRIDVVVGALAAISGRVVTADGQPVPHITLWLVPAREDGAILLRAHSNPLDAVESNAEGRFQFRDVLKGRWHVGLAPATGSDGRKDQNGGHSFMPITELVEVDGIKTSVEIVVRAVEGPVIRGTTIGADGKPVACLIEASHVTSSWETASRSNDDGSFELGPLPDGEFVLVAFEAGDRGADSVPTTFPAGTSGVELRLTPACAITVVIAPLGGKQLDADLRVYHSDDRFRATYCSTSNGVRTLTGLREGSLTVWAETSAGLCAIRGGIELRAGSTPTNVELHLAPSAKLTLRYQEPLDLEEYEVISGGARVQLSSYWLGKGSPLLVPAGSIEVRKVPRDGRPPEVHQLTLAPGEVRELVLGK